MVSPNTRERTSFKETILSLCLCLCLSCDNIKWMEGSCFLSWNESANAMCRTVRRFSNFLSLQIPWFPFYSKLAISKTEFDPNASIAVESFASSGPDEGFTFVQFFSVSPSFCFLLPIYPPNFSSFISYRLQWRTAISLAGSSRRRSASSANQLLVLVRLLPRTICAILML